MNKPKKKYQANQPFFFNWKQLLVRVLFAWRKDKFNSSVYVDIKCILKKQNYSFSLLMAQIWIFRTNWNCITSTRMYCLVLERRHLYHLCVLVTPHTVSDPNKYFVFYLCFINFKNLHCLYLRPKNSHFHILIAAYNNNELSANMPANEALNLSYRMNRKTLKICNWNNFLANINCWFCKNILVIRMKLYYY